MKKILISLLWMLLLSISASAQVKTFQMVDDNAIMVVNASDCVDRMGSNYLLWVRYDYKSKKDCKKEAKRDGVSGKPVRAEVLYEFVRSGLVKNLVWTLPALLLIRKYNPFLQVKLKEMFSLGIIKHQLLACSS